IVEDWRGRPASQAQPAATSTDDPFSQVLSSTGPDIENTANTAAESSPAFVLPIFAHPAQLISLPGFSKQLVAAILPSLTVANGSNQIDPYIAPIKVLAALPGVNDSNIEAFEDARDNSSRDAALKLLGASQAFVTDTAAPGWRLQITIREPSGRVFK